MIILIGSVNDLKLLILMQSLKLARKTSIVFDCNDFEYYTEAKKFSF